MKHPDIIEGIFDASQQSITRPRMTSTTTRSLEESRDMQGCVVLPEHSTR